ncbi:MAG: peptidoglycan editing factor PgeF [Defluviitaleaceae bacterium]|nr:peptidoglycan editing factor PgeF [Defluviitaleaceae bacterium]
MIIDKNGLKYFVFENLTAAGVRHCFSSRIGGVSGGVYSSLNLGLNNGDDAAAVRENFERICGAACFDINNVIVSNQKHGIIVEKIDVAFGEMRQLADEADGLMTDKPNIVLTTYYADCVPLLFYDKNSGAVANAHAGWRGCADDMAGAAVAAMVKEYATCAKDLLVGIGPSICKGCFEVDKDVADKFKKQLPFSDKFVYNSIDKQNKYHVDLWQVCRGSLLAAGVLQENIEIAGLCTYELDELFFSHRRDGMPRGNMIGMIETNDKKGKRDFGD